MPIAHVRRRAHSRYCALAMRLNAEPEVTHTRKRDLALILAAAALCGGCGSHSPGGGPAGQATTQKVAGKPVNPIDQLSRNMVSAVPSSKPSTLPVQVKFELRERPDVGQPLEVDLAIVPMSASVDRVSGKVEGDDGLELIEGGEIAAADRPAEGVPIRHSIKVLPKREGLFTVHALLTVDASGQPATDTYSMPLIASPAPPDDAGKPAGTSTAAVTAHTTASGTAAAQ